MGGRRAGCCRDPKRPSMTETTLLSRDAERALLLACARHPLRACRDTGPGSCAVCRNDHHRPQMCRIARVASGRAGTGRSFHDLDREVRRDLAEGYFDA